jgi:serine/threonine protein kinase
MHQAPLRASRLVTDPLARDGLRPQQAQQTQQAPEASIRRSTPAAASSTEDRHQLAPGTLLRGGRYRLQEPLERQDWLSGVYEAVWIAQDAQRGASQVMMYELVLPENSIVTQSTLRTATMALTSVGRHPHIPTLWDAFSDQGRNFFVFEAVDGESLLARMRRTGRAIPEQDVIECCLQMTEVLELLAQQSPPLVHGLIRPEHIVISRYGAQYMLTNFSIVLAGGASQFVSGIDRTRLTPYVAPEFVRGLIDVRTDLYSLLATAYHAVTGSPPAGVSGSIPQAQRINPNVSAQFDAILSKGLRPVSSQRYQRPSELRQDLLAMRSVSSTLVSNPGQQAEPALKAPVSSDSQPFSFASQSVQDTVAQTFQSIAPAETQVEENKSLVPPPEELPAMSQGNDLMASVIWAGLILVFLIVLVALSRGFA